MLFDLHLTISDLPLRILSLENLKLFMHPGVNRLLCQSDFLKFRLGMLQYIAGCLQRVAFFGELFCDIVHSIASMDIDLLERCVGLHKVLYLLLRFVQLVNLRRSLIHVTHKMSTHNAGNIENSCSFEVIS